MLADKVFMKLRATDGSSVALYHCTLEFKDKSKTVGVARQQLHFLCSDKAHWFNIRVGSKRKLVAALGMSDS